MNRRILDESILDLEWAGLLRETGLYLLLASDDVGGADRLRVLPECHVKPEDELGVLRNAVGLAHEEVDERVG